MRTFLLLAITVSAFAEEAEQRHIDFAAPDGRCLVRLYSARDATIGNCPYDRAELIQSASKKVLYEFTALGGFVRDSVVWSPASTHVAVYTHDHRTGEPLVVQLTKAGVNECTIPDIELPHERHPENAGRQWQSWLKPKKWLSESVLLLSDSGVIQQQKGVQANLVYYYAVQVAFDRSGAGAVKSIKRVGFDKDKSWLKLHQ